MINYHHSFAFLFLYENTFKKRTFAEISSH